MVNSNHYERYYAEEKRSDILKICSLQTLSRSTFFFSLDYCFQLVTRSKYIELPLALFNDKQKFYWQIHLFIYCQHRCFEKKKPAVSQAILHLRRFFFLLGVTILKRSELALLRWPKAQVSICLTRPFRIYLLQFCHLSV